MEIKDKFKTPEELIDFVLSECGDIEYDHFHYKGRITLTIKSQNPILDYVSYINLLLKEQFSRSINQFSISNVSITTIPADFFKNFNELEYFACDMNELTELPELPDSLEDLLCASNQLIELPKLPKKLKHLFCQSNQLTELPKLPEKLVYLYCGENQLIELPELPKSLNTLYCSGNPGFPDWFKNKQYKVWGDLNFAKI